MGIIQVADTAMEITITVVAKNTTPIANGKSVSEVLTYVITDLLTRVQLEELIDKIEPVLTVET